MLALVGVIVVFVRTASQLLHIPATTAARARPFGFCLEPYQRVCFWPYEVVITSCRCCCSSAAAAAAGEGL